METQNTDEDDQFLDALDDFPFYDSLAFDESDLSTSELCSTLRQRVFSSRGISSIEPRDSSTIEDQSKTGSFLPRNKLYRDLKANDDSFEITESTSGGLNSTCVVEEKSDDESAVTTVKIDELVAQARNTTDPDTQLSESLFSSSSLLVFIAGLVIKAIGFQFNFLTSFITLPLSVLSWCYMFVIDPFRALRHGRAYIIKKLLNLWNSTFGYLISCLMHGIGWFKDQKSIWTIGFRFGWGLLCAAYVGFVLCGLLLTSLVISGVLMRYLVEKPLEIKEILNFDYTKSSPVAFVPIVSCAAVACGEKCTEKIYVGKKSVVSPGIPQYHKLHVTVSLTLPESDYNRNLGMFQVRVDFLSVNGETLASSSHPCMLRFKSQPIRLLLTVFKVASLVTGYVSEVQTLNLKTRGLNEGIVPTACLRVVLENRAEYRSGAGIPELYDASLILESELPFMKRIIWYWKKTIFIWLSITSFTMELLFALVCCRPILIPRTGTRDASASSRSIQNRAHAQI